MVNKGKKLKGLTLLLSLKINTPHLFIKSRRSGKKDHFFMSRYDTFNK